MDTLYRADVVGSLLRPAYLKRAHADLHAGRIDRHQFKQAEDRAVDAAIEVQERAGVDIVTDGEMRRMLFTGSLTEAVEGISSVRSIPVDWAGAGEHAEKHEQDNKATVVTGKLHRVRSLATEEYSYARARTSKPLKVTLPSPMMLAFFWSPEHSAGCYSDPFDLFANAAALLREEIRELQNLGCRHIQIDAPEISTLVSDDVRRHFDSIGISTERMLDEGVDLLNQMVSKIDGVTLSIHFCRGNKQGQWMASGGYQAVQDVFPRLGNFDRYLLEYDSDRAGNFEPLKKIPDGKVVVLGLVSTKSNAMESVEALAKRIDEAAGYFARDQFAVSTQCGFASVFDGNPIDEHVQEAKLRLVVETATRI